MAVDALEAARDELVSRLRANGFPTTLSHHRMVVNERDDGGTEGKYEQIAVSSLFNEQVQHRVGDETVQGTTLGFRGQLQPLAELLAAETRLDQRKSGLYPTLRGVDAVLIRFLCPMTATYLTQLPDLASDDLGLAKELADGLVELCSLPVNKQRIVTQVAVSGIGVSEPLKAGNCEVRPLTPEERGLEWQRRTWSEQPGMPKHANHYKTRPPGRFDPVCVIEVEELADPLAPASPTPFINQVVLAMMLLGWELAGDGHYAAYALPGWAQFGTRHSPSYLNERAGTDQKAMTSSDLQEVMDLAQSMPAFGRTDNGGHEVILSRTMAGLGAHWNQSGLLDFVIALEGALLRGTRSELAYQFALRGALFLADTRDSKLTYQSLKNIYDVRSRIVHGGTKVSASKRQTAEQEIKDLTRAIVLKGLRAGWPDPEMLTDQALGIEPTG